MRPKSSRKLFVPILVGLGLLTSTFFYMKANSAGGAKSEAASTVEASSKAPKGKASMTKKPVAGEAFSVFGKSVSTEELMKNNTDAFYEIEMKKYNTVKQLAQAAYLEAFWAKMAKEQKVTSEKAMQDYLSKNVKVSDDEVKTTMARVKDHPSFKSLSETEKLQQVQDFLKAQSSRALLEKVMGEAEAKGDLVISYSAPKQPRFSVSINDDDIVRYGPKMSDTKPIGCKGNDCPIKVIEYSEYQCPFCARVLPSTKKVLEDPELKGQIAWVVRDFPLSFHKRAQPAGVAARCAGFQGKYWEMYHQLFDNQKNLEDADFEKYGKAIGLDMDKYNACYKKPGKAHEIVAKNTASGHKLGVSGTPAFFINGLRFSGAISYEDFMTTIKAEMSEVKAAKKRSAAAEAEAQPAKKKAKEG